MLNVSRLFLWSIRIIIVIIIIINIMIIIFQIIIIIIVVIMIMMKENVQMKKICMIYSYFQSTLQRRKYRESLPIHTPCCWYLCWRWSSEPLHAQTATAPHNLGNVSLTLMLLVANLANTKWCKNPEKPLKLWHMGTQQELSNEHQHDRV